MPFWKRKSGQVIIGGASLAPKDEPPEPGQYGIFILRNKASDAPDMIDVVAVHGLNGHYQKTWTELTSAGEVNWLQDLLPEQLPNARIMSYGYNSAVEFSKAAAGIKTFAEQLLEDLMAWRLSAIEKERPVIFICHSLGGIVFKQALIRAHERDRFQGLLSRIRGVAFFGTPHRGSDLADWGSMLANIIKSATLGTRSNTILLNQLRSRSEILQDISKSFVDRGKNLVILSFYETDKMEYLNCKVVPEESAIMNLPNETSIAVNGNHRTICRFSSLGENRYRSVWVNIQNMANAEINNPISDEERVCLLALYTSDYESHKNRNPKPTAGTCKWILHHENYLGWLKDCHSSLLWISADPGCGKSVLATFLIDRQASQNASKRTNSCYFFFKDDNDEQRSSVYALCALLHQIYTSQPKLLKHAASQYNRKGKLITAQFDTLWSIFMATIRDTEANDTICFIDGIDECQELPRSKLLMALASFFQADKANLKIGPVFKVIVTSRPENSIKAGFQNVAGIRLRGEDETTAISHDVELVIQESINDMNGDGLGQEILQSLQEKLIEGADRTFLWTTLTIKLLRDASERGASRKELEEILLNRDIDSIYTQLLENSANIPQAKKMLQIVLAAARPLTIDEMNVAMAVPAQNAARVRPIYTTEIKLAQLYPPEIKNLDDLAANLKFSFENTVKSLCGHFLRVIDQRIYLVHQTAREYLLFSRVNVLAEIRYVGHSFSQGEFSQGEEELVDWTRKEDVPDNSQRLSEAAKDTPKIGLLQNSMKIEMAIRELLDICVSYIYLFNPWIKYSEQSPVWKLLDYSALYWTTHFKELRDLKVLDIQNPRYLSLVDPEFVGFETWTSAHPSYRLNFPGRLHIPGAAAASDHVQELRIFFGLEELLPSREKLEADRAIGLDTTGFDILLMDDEFDSKELDEVDYHEELDDDVEEVKRLPDRFQRYKALQSWKAQAEIGARSMSQPSRGGLFPVRGGTFALSSAPSVMEKS